MDQSLFGRAIHRPRAQIAFSTGVRIDPLESRQLMSAAVFAMPTLASPTPAETVTAAPAVTLPVPAVVSPGSSVAPGPVLTTLTPTFSWDAVTSGSFTGYQLHVIDLATDVITSYSIGKSATSYTLPTPLVAGVKYVWNLRVADGTSTAQPGTYLYFQAPPAVTLPAPSVVSPGSTTAPGPVLTTLSPTFTWHAVTGVTFTSYQLNLENVTTSTFTSFQISNTATSFTVPTALPAGDTFVWNLRLDDGTQSGPPSAYLNFQTPPAATLPVPTVVSPGSPTAPGPVLTTLTPTFTWDAVTEGTFAGYQLHVIDLATNVITSYSIDKPATSFTLPTPLTPGVDYVWNLRTVNGTVTGLPGTYLYFQAPPAVTLPAPIVVSPGSTTAPGPVLNTLSPTFVWHAVTGVTFTGYQLNLENLTTATFTSFQISDTATNFTVPSPLPAGDKFVWNLRLIDGTQSGPPSAYLNFETPPAATLPVPTVVSPGSSTAPGPVLTTLTPTFTWDAITEGTFTGYQLHVINLSTNVITSYSIGKTATSFTLPTPLTPGVKYVWNLRTVNGTATGSPGTYLYFQAPATELVAPTVIGPGSTQSPGPVVTTTTPTFTWKAVTGVTFDTYQLNLYDETNATFLSFQISSADTQFTPPAGTLAAGDSFVWNLRLKVGTTTGPESAYLYFTTEA